jgi:DNA-binding response OmpR family regulator
MRVLIAEDEPISRRVLEATLERWGYQVIVTTDGAQAWDQLSQDDAPRLVVLDWMMPGLDGPEVCRRVRARPDGNTFYLLLLTAKAQVQDIVSGLSAGADDYVSKPFNRDELQARIKNGRRVIELQQQLRSNIDELEEALGQVKTLTGLLPICTYCKKIREGDSYWQAVEEYLAQHSQALFSHGVCPDCYERHVRPKLDRL